MPTGADPSALLQRLAVLGDGARLRMMRLLSAHELSVGELARATQLPQSTVSRHLKLLHDGNWVEKRAAGTASLYRLADERLDEGARALWTVAHAQLGATPTLDEDDRRLREVLAERRNDSRAFFGRIGGEWDEMRHELFGPHFTAAALLAFIPSHWTIADLGCGTGNAAEMLAPHVARIIAIDREPAMLDAARTRLAAFDHVEFRSGELRALPLKRGEADALLISLVLHHIEDPAAAIVAAASVLGPGGAIVVVDMVAHDREEYRQTMGHQHLGFDEATVAGWADAAGLTGFRYHALRPDTQTRGPSLFVARMEKA